MDTAYRNALARKRELEAELARVDDFLRLYQEFAGRSPSADETAAAHHTEFVQGKLLQEEQLAPGAPPASRSNRKTGSREEFARVARQVLLDTGRPMSRSEIADAVMARGVHVGGKDKAANVGTLMWRMNDRFVNLPGLGYWPKDVEYSPARYSPTSGADTTREAQT